MTIDEAIKYADMLANDASTVWEIPMMKIQRLNTLCADALRNMQKMSDKPKGSPSCRKSRKYGRSVCRRNITISRPATRSCTAW